MNSAIVDCLACRNKGEIVVHPGPTQVRSKAYEHLGRSIASGYLYLLCKCCGTVLLIDPAGLFGPDQEAAVGIVRLGSLHLKKWGYGLSGPEKVC